MNKQCNARTLYNMFDTRMFVNPYVKTESKETIKCSECGADMEWVWVKSNRLGKIIKGLELHCNNCGYHVPWKCRIRVPKKGHRSE